MMESAIDSPAIALFNQPATNTAHRASPRHFVTRSLRNLRQGNFALLIVFFGCLVIFVRALFGAGYDEGYSAQADAASAKHPSLLARWGSQPQHAIEAQWNKLREKRSESTSAGLWAKIRKEDEGAASTPSAKVPGEDALHWLRVMEDKALSGLGRKPRPDAPLAHEHGVAMHAGHVQVPVSVPEHPISEDLDEHDVHDGDEPVHSHGDEHVHPPPAPHEDEHNEAPPVAPPVAPSDDHDYPRAPSSPDAPADSSESTIADASPQPSSSSELAEEATPLSPPPPSHDPEHEDDADDEPVFMRDEHR